MTESKRSMPLNVLETHRLILRPWTSGDVSSFHQLWGDPKVVWGRDALADRGAAEQALAAELRRWSASPQGQGAWAVVERSSGEIIGNVSLQDSTSSAGQVELSYHVMSTRWNEGVATEASHAVLRYALLALGLKTVSAIVPVDHSPSCRVAEKLGMNRDGDVIHGGQTHHVYVFLPEEVGDHWEPVQGDWP
jgi:[ribosomal protein S5]-alanine N-acetyltransferase